MLFRSKTVDEAQAMSGEDLAAPLGALPPVRIHCAQLVEGALRSALSGDNEARRTNTSLTLLDQLSAKSAGKVKVVVDPK